MGCRSTPLTQAKTTPSLKICIASKLPLAMTASTDVIKARTFSLDEVWQSTTHARGTLHRDTARLWCSA